MPVRPSLTPLGTLAHSIVASLLGLAATGAAAATPGGSPVPVLEVSRPGETRLSQYLSTHFASEITEVRAGAKEIVIRGRVQAQSAPAYLVEVPIHRALTDTNPFPWVGAIRPNRSGRFTLSVDRQGSENPGQSPHDRLFSRWAVMRQEATGPVLLSHARYADVVEPRWQLPVEKPRGRKGLGALSPDRPLRDIEDLGISAVTVNVVLGSFMRTLDGPGRTPFSVGGRTWFIDDAAVGPLDRTMEEAARHRLIVSAILLVQQAAHSADRAYGRMVTHADADPYGHFAMPAVNTPDGHEAYAAALEWLARRYCQPGSPHGRIHHWIVHNEVDAAWEWTNAGEKTALEYLDLYQRSLRTVHLIARQYDVHAQAFISLTHFWTARASPHCYPSRELLELLLQFGRAEGDFDWAIAHHPYPEDLFNPRTWEDKSAQMSFDTPQITFKNLEVLDAWVRQQRTLFQGKTRRTVHLTEQGPNSRDYTTNALQLQAAAMAYVWKKLERLDTIQVFHFHNWVDNRGEGGLRIGLRKFPDEPGDPLGRKPVWHVFRALDTPGQAQAIEFAKPLIGIQEWDEAQHKTPIR